MPPLMPPRAYFAFTLADVREQSAENAKGNTIRFNHFDTEINAERFATESS